MNKIMTFLSMALLISVMTATSAMALTANHAYTVQLHSVSAAGVPSSTPVAQMNATSDMNGKLSFQFSNVPDSGSTPFLMIQIMDGGTMVRQSLAPAPTAGQQLQMGVSEISHRQTQAALQAMMGATSTGESALRAMFPLTMIATGNMLDADADSFGQAAHDAATAFATYLNNNGATATQMANFQNGLLDAMRTFAAENRTAVDDTVTNTAAGKFGLANAQLMTAMMQAGNTAGIDPTLLAAAFDQAGQAMDSSTALASLSPGQFAAMQTNYMAGTQQRQMLGQMNGYAAAMPVVGASPTQTQTLTSAMGNLQSAMVTARQSFCQQAFADPMILPTQATLDTAVIDMQTAMNNAFGDFNTATDGGTQIGTMLDTMASGMNGMGGMMGGTMMTGTTLAGLNLGMMQTSIGGPLQNWSTMMVAGTNLLPSVAGMTYTPVTSALTTQLSDLSPASMPIAPDLSLLPTSPDKSLLQLQYDLMLVHLIDVQMATNLAPLDPAAMATISAADLANRDSVMLGLSGLTDVQKSALMHAMSPLHLI
ncbi:hypothetical protein [Geopsychrobacter electrodiphilus]|uniref:hypothetical protein n=1 Tax=Geopsychrobacter electrodiphilus TaxID=225196 RepID=UPI00036967B3|nr:hypothetical protein [Geopsychrobacter electrodiphilus]